MTFSAPIDIAAARLPLRITLETRIERSEEGRRMSYVDIRAMAETPGMKPIEVGRLTAWRGLYPDLAQILSSPDEDARIIVEEFDEISYDAVLAVEGILDARGSFAPRIASQISDARPSGLVYIEQVVVHPALRGRGLGHALLRELKAQLSGVAHLACLKAIPIDTPYEEPGDDFAHGSRMADRAAALALQRYYRADAALGFQRPASGAKGSLLGAVWEAFPDMPLFEMRAEVPAAKILKSRET